MLHCSARATAPNCCDAWFHSWRTLTGVCLWIAVRATGVLIPVLLLCAAGLCKKGADTCESLHVYDLSKMPLCQFIIDYGACHNADCLFNHTRPETVEEKPDCIWYARGFCKQGPECKRRHRKKEMCPDYLGQ